MNWVREFRDFAIKGNVVDLAVAVIIGAAFGRIVSSMVADIITPVVGIFLGGLDFKGLAVQVGSAKIAYGSFIQAVFDFSILAFVIFLGVKAVNHFRRKQEDKPPVATPPRQEQLLEEIRDLLKGRAR